LTTFWKLSNLKNPMSQCYRTNATSTWSRVCLPTKISINVRAKSMAVPGPLEVTTVSSLTIGVWRILVCGSAKLSSTPG